MNEMPFRASDLGATPQCFLYACAFWLVATDEQLSSEEQVWLAAGFGEERATELLGEFSALEGAAFYRVFDDLRDALTDEEKALLYPGLLDWLHGCAAADGMSEPEEQETLERLKKRIGLQAELRRLVPVPAPVAEKVESVRVRTVVGPDPESAAAQPGVDSAAEASTSPWEEVAVLSGHQGDVTCLAVSGDGGVLVSGAEGGAAMVWDVDAKAPRQTMEADEVGVLAVAVCPDGRRVVTGGRTGGVRLWDVDGGGAVWSMGHGRLGGACGIAVSADGARLAACFESGVVSVCDVGTGDEVRSFGERRHGAIRDVAFSPDGTWLASGGDDRVVRLWDVASGEERAVLSGHEDGVLCVAFSAEGQRIVSGGRDNTVRVWDAGTREAVSVLSGHGFSVLSARFSQDGRHVLSASWDHSVRVWDVDTGAPLVTMESFGSRFSDAVYLPGGGRFAAAGSDKAVHIVGYTLP